MGHGGKPHGVKFLDGWLGKHDVLLLSVVVIRSPDVFMGDGDKFWLAWQSVFVQVVLKDRLDAFVVDSLDGERPLAGGLQPVLAETFPKGDDAHDRSGSRVRDRSCGRGYVSTHWPWPVRFGQPRR